MSLFVAACAQAQSCTPVVEFSHEENATGFINKGITDAEIAVGESQILVCSNTNLVLHDKTGATISGQKAALGDYPSASDPFFVRASGSGGVIGDPAVLYDYHSERFWLLVDDVLVFFPNTPLYSHYQFAVSVGSSTAIAGSDQWIYFDEEIYETDINTPPYRIVHNQMIAVDQEAFYSVGLHESQDEPGGDRVKTTLIHVWDKSDLLLGTQPTPTILDLPNVYGDETWGMLLLSSTVTGTMTTRCTLSPPGTSRTHPTLSIRTRSESERSSPMAWEATRTITSTYRMMLQIGLMLLPP